MEAQPVALNLGLLKRSTEPALERVGEVSRLAGSCIREELLCSSLHSILRKLQRAEANELDMHRHFAAARLAFQALVDRRHGRADGVAVFARPHDPRPSAAALARGGNAPRQRRPRILGVTGGRKCAGGGDEIENPRAGTRIFPRYRSDFADAPPRTPSAFDRTCVRSLYPAPSACPGPPSGAPDTLAEGMRFELTMGFPPYTLSKRAP